MLGSQERTLPALAERHREEGADGLVDRRVGQPSPRRATLASSTGRRRSIRDVRRLHGEALPREAGEAARLQARLHGDPAVPAGGGAGEAGAAARGASAQAAAPAAAGHDAAPGRLAARLARRPAGARPGGDDGRRDQRALLGVPGRGGRHRLELARRCCEVIDATACSARSTPTAAATTSSRRRPAAASTGRS